MRQRRRTGKTPMGNFNGGRDVYASLHTHHTSTKNALKTLLYILLSIFFVYITVFFCVPIDICALFGVIGVMTFSCFHYPKPVFKNKRLYAIFHSFPGQKCRFWDEGFCLLAKKLTSSSGDSFWNMGCRGKLWKCEVNSKKHKERERKWVLDFVDYVRRL